MPAKADPKVMEAVELALAGDDTSAALAKVGLEISKSMRRNVNKHASFRRKEQQEALVETAAPEVLTAIQKTAAEAVGTAAAALAIAEGAQKVATAAAVAAARRISDVVGGRRNRKQAQAVWVKQDAEKEERKRIKSKAHKDATLAFKAEMEKPRGERQSSAQVAAFDPDRATLEELDAQMALLESRKARIQREATIAASAGTGSAAAAAMTAAAGVSQGEKRVAEPSLGGAPQSKAASRKSQRARVPKQAE